MKPTFPIYCLLVLSFAIGYIFCGFTEVLQAESWAIPSALLGTLLLNCFAAKNFIESYWPESNSQE